MHRFKNEKHIRQSGLGIMMIAASTVTVLIASSGSCLLETRTIHCPGFNLRCKPVQVCSPAENDGFECVDIGSCGDGNLDEGEECDDGNLINSNPINGDKCDSNCTLPRCGNMIQALDKERRDEECDSAGVDTVECNGGTCQKSNCGDGYLNTVAGEECDDGPGLSAKCNSPSICKLSKCGDSFYNMSAGEACDTGGDTRACNGDGNGDTTNNPDAECKVPICGDGYTNSSYLPLKALPGETEQCDTLGGGDTKDCNGNDNGKESIGSCREPSCGDGYANSKYLPSKAKPGETEQCDTLGGGDTKDCNGNDSGKESVGSCRTPSCGDGYINPMYTPSGASAVEQCDNPGGVNTRECNGNNGGTGGIGSCRVPRCDDGYFNSAAEKCDRVGGVSVGCMTGVCNADCMACI